MFELDIRTLLVVTTLVSIGSAVALISLWRSQSQPNGAGFWALGMSCVAVASVLISGRGIIFDFISIVIANSVYVIGFLLILRGIRIFTNRPPLLFLDYSLPVISALFFYYFNYIDQNINIRIAVISTMFVIICFTIVSTLLSDKNAPWRQAGTTVAAVFGLFGLFHGSRGVLALLTPFEYDFMQTSISSSLVFLGSIFILGGSAITLILLTHSTLQSKLQIASLAVNQSASSIIITDTNGTIRYVNPAFTEKTGYLPQEIIGKNPRILNSGEIPAEEYATLWKELSAGNTWRGEFHNRKKNGELFWEIASIAPVKRKNGKITHFVGMKEDITALKNAEQRILHMANHDTLTGLPTRRLSMDRLKHALAYAKRNETKMAVLFVDLDDFKAINDIHGHEIGDKVLKETANRLRTCVREADTVSRIGGDEFWLLLTNISDKNCVIAIANKLIEVVTEPHKLADQEITIGVSIGIALYPEHGVEPQELVNLADQAMYGIKRQGKNNYSFSETIRFT
ncbi:diguanylate cyclase [Vibrio sp. TH_r3]|uniref:diguanylate cyclase domain-containing protein n=1 Tax=Vibrio sp. TH_r3 TaxID=3082084 RepID=UPI00295538FE|nr:diguanylate cyclase [Vibrio sp. TH_r3]MDV7105266.1 diguanylate cyclase [Vibrio sp. TH_r3]